MVSVQVSDHFSSTVFATARQRRIFMSPCKSVFHADLEMRNAAQTLSSSQLYHILCFQSLLPYSGRSEIASVRGKPTSIIFLWLFNVLYQIFRLNFMNFRSHSHPHGLCLFHRLLCILHWALHLTSW